MDPIVEGDWLGSKNESTEQSQNLNNIIRNLQWRERGINPPNTTSNRTVLENSAEDTLVQKCPLIVRCYDLPGFPRSTFLMVFSPDGTKVASTHGNHNIYVSELASGKHVRILKGHPRTPWCIAFHPSHTQLIGSGCLGGQVRVWDLSGGSEVWTVDNETVIASLAFHPRDQLLVIATFNELYFWDWSQPAPFTKVSTNNINEKVRYVAFDSLGYKLITGISVWCTSSGNNSLLQTTPPPGGPPSNLNFQPNQPQNNQSNRQQEDQGSTQELIVTSYHNLVQRYDSLVRNYRRLFLARNQLASTPPANMTDRGTDPMESDLPSTSTASHQETSSWPSSPRPSTSQASMSNDTSSSQSPDQRATTPSAEIDSTSSRFLNLDVLSLNPNSPNSTPTRPQDVNQIPTFTSSLPQQERPLFGSRRSAFQPLNENIERRNSNNFGSQNVPIAARVLPNPFSSSSVAASTDRITFTRNSLQSSSSNTQFVSSRTHRHNTQYPSFLYHRHRHFTTAQAPSVNRPISNERSQPSSNTPQTSNETTSTVSSTLRNVNTTLFSTRQRPATTNSSTQISPVAAQTINESLDLIRDILRDSGTRLLNLITNMSLSTLASVERSVPRRHDTSQTQSDDSDGVRRSRRRRSRVRLFSSRIRRQLLSSGSDSDSDHSLEVNIYRTRNTSFSEEGTTRDTSNNGHVPTSRLVVDLDLPDNESQDNEESSQQNNANRINITVSNNRFRVRTQHSQNSNGELSAHRVADNEFNERTVRSPNPQETRDPSLEADANNTNRPSTSRDNSWMDDPYTLNSRPNGAEEPMTSSQAFRKVKSGVIALQKHAVMLADMWLHGNRIPLHTIRNMWDNLRRRILSLHRQTGRQDIPSYYTRSLLERCRFLTEMSRNMSRNANNNSNNNNRSSSNGPSQNVSAQPEREAEPRADSSTSCQTDVSNTTIPTSAENQPSTSTAYSNLPQRSQPLHSHVDRNTNSRSTPKISRSTSTRRRLPTNCRWRPEDELWRRSHIPLINRWSFRSANRPGRRDNIRNIELHCTRHEIRVRAMQVLSIMFNMMMSCLEERELSTLIILMLRTLKRSLGITCLLLMSNRYSRRESDQRNNGTDDPVNINDLNISLPVNNTTNNTGSTNNDLTNINGSTNNDSTNNNGPSNSVPIVEPAETSSDNAPRLQNNESNTRFPWSANDTEDNICDQNESDSSPISTCLQESSEADCAEDNNIASPLSSRWSNRLAVQISEANRNNSTTAKSRREMYTESKRQKALHRCNPKMHPLLKKKVLPPSSTYRIPTIRRFPNKMKTPEKVKPSNDNTAVEPIPGPSYAQPGPSNVPTQNANNPLRDARRLMREPRVNLLRLAHVHASRMSNTAQNHYRIHLFPPNYVREMLELPNASEGTNANESPSINTLESPVPRIIASLRSQVLSRNELDNSFGAANRNNTFSTIMNNQGQENNMQEPQVNISSSSDVHEYLQPIILAQNAIVLEDSIRGGGPGGLLETGLISETLPAPAHRVQAWDFTLGEVPHISDSTKNIVVQRCRIHNDASIDISKDGRLLVALLPVPRLRNSNHRLGVYSLEWERLGQCLHTAALEQSAVSVALSPTARYLAVGLGARRFTTAMSGRNNVFALLYRLESSSRAGLAPIRELDQNWEHGFTSLNCLRWAPQPGQGLVYANNTGQLMIIS